MALCYSNQLTQQLKTGNPALLLLWGDDAGAMRQAAAAAVAQSGLDPNDPFAADKLTINELISSSGTLAERAATVPFGAARRLVTLIGISGEETGEAKTQTLAALTDAVKATLQGPLESAFIVLAVPRLLEKKSALVKAVEAHPQALAVRFYFDAARDLSSYLQNAFKQAGARIESQALELLARHLGADRDIAAMEVQKLCLYAGDETITEEHVRQSVAGAVPVDVFRLAEAVGERDRAQTDRLTQNLLAQGEDLNGAFMVVVGHLQKLQGAQALLAQGADNDEILLKNGKKSAPNDAKQAFLRQVRGYPAPRLATLPAYAIEALTAARSGLFSANPQLPLARALLALAS